MIQEHGNWCVSNILNSAHILRDTLSCCNWDIFCWTYVQYLSVLADVVSRPHINHACLYSLQYRVKSIYSMWQTKVMSCSFVIYGSTLDIHHQLWPSLTSLMFCVLIGYYAEWYQVPSCNSEQTIIFVDMV